MFHTSKMILEIAARQNCFRRDRVNVREQFLLNCLREEFNIISRKNLAMNNKILIPLN